MDRPFAESGADSSGAVRHFSLHLHPLFRNHFSDQVQALFTPHPQGGDSPQDASAYDAMPAVRVMITANHEYGRCGQLSVSPGDPLCEQLAPLLRDAVAPPRPGGLPLT